MSGRWTAGAVLAMAMLTGACTVQTDPAGASRQAQFERDKKVRYDLSTQPRGAQRLGVKPGQTSGAFEPDGRDDWTYEITLPGGRLFRTRGFGHRVIVDPDQPGFPYNGVLVNSLVPDIDAAEQDMLAAAPVLGLDAQRITQWATQAQATPLTASYPDDSLDVVGTRLDYLTADVEVRRSEGHDDLVLNGDFVWGASAGTTATTPPALTPADGRP